MRNRFNSRFWSGRSALAVAMALSTGALTQAQITGFGGSAATGWQANSASGAAPSVSGSGDINDVLTLTTATNGITDSYFDTTLQPLTVGGWTASFTYTYTGTTTGTNIADGAAFVLQNDPRGTSAMGGGGGELGYAGTIGTGILKSEAFQYNLFSGDHNVGVNQFVNGAATQDASNATYLSTSPVNLLGAPVNVTLAYDGVSSVTQTLTQGANVFTNTYPVQGMQPVLGGNNSFYVGFTGATGGYNAGQQISNFTFTPTGAQTTKLINILKPGDSVVGINANGTAANSPSGEPASGAIDGSAQSKYLNFNKLGAGIFETPAAGATVADILSLTSANDSPERDPASYEVWGTNDTNAAEINPALNASWASFYTLISSGAVPGFSGRLAEQSFSFANSTAYTSYVVDFPTIANASAANSMQVADIQLTGTTAVPEPASIALVGLASVAMLHRRRSRLIGR